MVELRGFEPHREAAEIACELRWMFDSGVTRHAGVLRICVAVLRDVTVLAYGQMPSADPMSDPPLFRRTCACVGVVCAGQARRAVCNQTCWISSSGSLGPSWPHGMTPMTEGYRATIKASRAGAMPPYLRPLDPQPDIG